MAINLTIEFTNPTTNEQLNRDYEIRVAEWIRRMVAENYSHQQPDIHIDYIDEPWRYQNPNPCSAPTPLPGSLSA